MMRITLAQVATFESIARLGSVREASRQLNLAQPTVSLRLRDLENAMGVKLFERSGRGLTLTQQGSVVLESARRVLREVGKMKGLVGSQEIAGLVRLGVSETFAITGLPSLLRLVGSRHSELRVELVIGPSPDLLVHLDEHRVDLAIVVNPPSDPRLQAAPFGVQPASWAVSPDLGLPPTIRPSDILHHTILVNPSPYPMWRQTMNWFGSAGLEPPHLSMCHTVPSAIAHLVEAGIGIAILPTRLIAPQVASGRIVALNCRPQIEKSLLYAVRRAGHSEPALDAIVDAAREVLDNGKLLAPL